MIGQLLVGLIAVLHVYILVLEMFLWDKPYGLKAFGNSLEKAQLTKVLAQNQGLYNGFLAAGLFWALIAPETYAVALANFFLGCVLIAGIYGGLTASKKIIYIQSVPALLALIAVNFFKQLKVFTRSDLCFNATSLR
jgi:putative membrane protein